MMALTILAAATAQHVEACVVEVWSSCGVSYERTLSINIQVTVLSVSCVTCILFALLQGWAAAAVVVVVGV